MPKPADLAGPVSETIRSASSETFDDEDPLLSVVPFDSEADASAPLSPFVCADADVSSAGASDAAGAVEPLDDEPFDEPLADEPSDDAVDR